MGNRYEEINLAIDVLVVGAGAAGLSAAVAAAQQGARVLIVCAAPQPGGSLGWRADPLCESLLARASLLGVELLTRTVAFGIYDHNLVAARQELPPGVNGPNREGRLIERLFKIRARTVVSATGAIERPMVFPDNDRPGVMLAGAVEKYAFAYGVACGRRAVIVANCDHAYTVARSLDRAGINVVGIVDRLPRSLIHPAVAAEFSDVLSFESAVAKVSGSRSVRGC